jgi:hypothetical protein
MHPDCVTEAGTASVQRRAVPKASPGGATPTPGADIASFGEACPPIFILLGVRPARERLL